MRKFILLSFSLIAIMAVAIGLSSCKDDEPFVKPNLSFTTETLTVNESAGTIEVEVSLDKGAPADITIDYELSGTALSPADYSIVGKEGEVKIAKGETTGTISIQIINDALYEGNETIALSLEDVDSDDIIITNKDDMAITINDDDTQSKVSFEHSTLTVNEADDVVEIKVVLDKPLTVDVTIGYDLAGSATDSVSAKAADPDIAADYAIVGANPGQLVIKANQNTGIIRIRPYSDLALEDADQDTDPLDPEHIIITISEATNGIDFSANNTIDITMKQEDGVVILLQWPDPAGAQQADMDIILRVGQNTTTWDRILTGSASEGFTGPEYIFVPSGVIFPAYGVSYVYYDGTLDPLNFTVTFIDLVNQTFEPQASTQSFNGSYTAANKNKWTDPTTTKVVQTFTNVSGVFGDFSTIAAPATGSRMITFDPAKLLRKIRAASSAPQRKF